QVRRPRAPRCRAPAVRGPYAVPPRGGALPHRGCRDRAPGRPAIELPRPERSMRRLARSRATFALPVPALLSLGLLCPGCAGDGGGRRPQARGVAEGEAEGGGG